MAALVSGASLSSKRPIYLDWSWKTEGHHIGVDLVSSWGPCEKFGLFCLLHRKQMKALGRGVVSSGVLLGKGLLGLKARRKVLSSRCHTVVYAERQQSVLRVVKTTAGAINAEILD